MHAESKGEKFLELWDKMGIWMIRGKFCKKIHKFLSNSTKLRSIAYDLIDMLDQEDIQKFITKKLCENSQSLLIDLIKHITENSYSNCLDSKDKNTVKRDGGFLYLFSNGKVN